MIHSHLKIKVDDANAFCLVVVVTVWLLLCVSIDQPLAQARQALDTYELYN